MQNVLLTPNPYRMPRVTATLAAHHKIGPFGEHINDLALAFIAPLSANQNCISHKTKSPAGGENTFRIYRWIMQGHSDTVNQIPFHQESRQLPFVYVVAG